MRYAKVNCGMLDAKNIYEEDPIIVVKGKDTYSGKEKSVCLDINAIYKVKEIGEWCEIGLLGIDTVKKDMLVEYKKEEFIWYRIKRYGMPLILYNIVCILMAIEGIRTKTIQYVTTREYIAVMVVGLVTVAWILLGEYIGTE